MLHTDTDAHASCSCWCSCTADVVLYRIARDGVESRTVLRACGSSRLGQDGGNGDYGLIMRMITTLICEGDELDIWTVSGISDVPAVLPSPLKW
jgi:hypothetical protein